MSSLQSDAPIVWIDCEMTGLDRNIDELIEVAIIVTDAQLQPLDAGIDLVIKPSPAARNNMSAFVRDMHKNSGLAADLDAGMSLAEATQAALAYIQKLVPTPRVAPLGGNSVATDKFFLEKYMPELVEHLHYRIIDVSTIKELAKRWYPRAYFHAPTKTGNHRAIGDIKDSIAELQYYRAVLFPPADSLDSATCIAAAREISSAGHTK